MKKMILLLAFLLLPANGFAGMEIGDKELSIPINEVNDGQAHYYSVNLDGKEIRFFVVRSKDGIIRAAFDACDVCYRSKKGYSQQGDFMVCNNCGMRFHSTRINVVKGGCNPSPLARETKDDKLVISLDAVRSGAMYF
ncbi:DUF2318 domain-containing protein [Maridesulfovibrio salexigens]|uniref:Membrane iron-sulfur containing protein FtrD-like domain-containing protein n=1 Tax=Maridesulfovibrio salexigens (strain ATCC 14822 / DSM 2638 / NCIMB 8403 / VKM B-1763) TaxID=526222 RepID=C6BYF9_MARSD|nr:DUF2318 domain-containing protein [Maridesulfovibrio salexigens]ACS78750.1 conserved hypothetical protein [Maridesulfovibrio salexigens DSM 2638]